MKISVIGCGYLGAVHAASMAKLGHEVIGIDTDTARVAALNNGQAPFFEPGLPELLHEGLSSKKLSFSSTISDVQTAEVHFVCVGTPQKPGEYAADVQYVDAAFTALFPYMQAGSVAVGKSTVPVGTASRIAQLMVTQAPNSHLIWNPEFLREGHAVSDTLTPDRLVYGLSDELSAVPAAAKLDEVYAAALSAGTPRLQVNYATAELVKSAANSFLATKISFINAMAEVCEASGADVTALADAIGMDDRIGRKFLNAGIGFGGGCLPKDIRAFMARAGELGADQALTFLREVDAINMRRRSKVVERTRELCGGSLIGKRITVLGATFKPNSDDVRDSPALSIAAQLQLQGATVTVTDPQGLANARVRFPELKYEQDAMMACRNADAVLLLTEWPEFIALDPLAIGEIVASKTILDGRNALEPKKWTQHNWDYYALGRS